jgi:ADP-L-glycero-D-manno-heptose 6-epimerase
MIVLTGAAGFIASCLLQKLNESGYTDIILVDDFSKPDRHQNFQNKSFTSQMDREAFPEWFKTNATKVAFVFHLGARTDTTEFDRDLLNHLNLFYSQSLFETCTAFNIPIVYASSAATYGLGEFGYDDQDALAFQLHPLNPYGESKNDFDKWVLAQSNKPDHWKGVKFFNVYGPNEWHKGRMASVVFHTFNQVQATGAMRLFRSHHPDYKDGEQLRDFIYVKDVVDVLMFFYHNQQGNGLYNLGTGKARSFKDLATATFVAMGLEPQISFIDTPFDIRDKYQYFTEANMQKLKNLGYSNTFFSLEAGVMDYVKNYLLPNKIY